MKSEPVRDLVQRSREAQGLPSHVEDPGTLARVAELVALAGATRKDTSEKTALAHRGNGGSQSGVARRERSGMRVLAARCTEDTLH